jgi:hypothetical protein
MIYKLADWDIHNLDAWLNYGFVINDCKVFYFKKGWKSYEN